MLQGLQRAKAHPDDYLRDVLVADLYCASHPVASALAQGPVLRAIQRNRSDFARGAAATMTCRPLQTPGGIYLGEFPTVTLDDDRFLRAVGFIMRGLFYHATQRVFLADYAMDIRRLHQLSIPSLWESMGRLTKRAPFVMGSGVFTSSVAYATEDFATTCWLLAF
jgi:hypothetical protein